MKAKYIENKFTEKNKKRKSFCKKKKTINTNIKKLKKNTCYALECNN